MILFGTKKITVFLAGPSTPPIEFKKIQRGRGPKKYHFVYSAAAGAVYTVILICDISSYKKEHLRIGKKRVAPSN